MTLITQFTTSLARFASDDAPPFDAGSKQHAITSESVAREVVVATEQGVRGTRYRQKQGRRVQSVRGSGSITMDLTTTEFDNWVPRICGAASKVANVWTPGLDIPTFAALIDVGSGAGAATHPLHWQLEDCLIARATFRGNNRTPYIQMQLDLQCGIITNNESWPAAVPAIAGTTKIYPVFADTAFYIGSDAISVFGWEVVIDNAVNMENASGSVNPQLGRALDFNVTCNLELATSLYTGAGDLFTTRYQTPETWPASTIEVNTSDGLISFFMAEGTGVVTKPTVGARATGSTTSITIECLGHGTAPPITFGNEGS